MRCPRCGSVLEERERDGVVVDACIACRGVWLDRGELEKVIIRLRDEIEDRSGCACEGAPGGDWPPTLDRRHSHHPRRKRGWVESLSDLFD
jgi:uncharacterized protein